MIFGLACLFGVVYLALIKPLPNGWGFFVVWNSTARCNTFRDTT